MSLSRFQNKMNRIASKDNRAFACGTRVGKQTRDQAIRAKAKMIRNSSKVRNVTSQFKGMTLEEYLATKDT